MLRIIVRVEDFGKAANVGGAVETAYVTFDVDIPHVEAYLRTKDQWGSREVIGVELLQAPPAAYTPEADRG